jgi:hypothetical protein
VIAGENRVCACTLAWLNAAEALGLLGEEPQLRGALIVPEVVHRRFAQAPAGRSGAPGSAARMERPVVMAHPALPMSSWPVRQEGRHDAVRECCDPGRVRVELTFH